MQRRVQSIYELDKQTDLTSTSSYERIHDHGTSKKSHLKMPGIVELDLSCVGAKFLREQGVKLKSGRAAEIRGVKGRES